MNKWLGFYYPSTVLFIDDQKVFLEAIKHRLPSNILARYFDKPQCALDTIFECQRQETNYFSEYDDVESEQGEDRTCFTLNIGALPKISYKMKRFSEISVVVVDRKMPEMDGINFCRSIADKPIKKIMLTASKDRKIATEAFNEGIIDFFLLKDSPDLIPQLLLSIENLQKQYFFDLNQKVIGGYLQYGKNKKLQQFVQDKVRHFGGIEFYLLDKWGSTVIIKEDGTTITLAVTPAGNMENFASLAEEQDQLGLSSSLFKKESLVFFPNEHETMRPAKEWSEYVFDATPVPEQNDLYYAIIEESSMQPLDIHKVFSRGRYQVEQIF